jgi:hypothetical protein
MMTWLNHHSFLVLVVAVLVFGVVVASSIGRRPWIRGIVIGSLGITVLLAYVTLASGESTHVTESSVLITLGDGSPTFIEFYSDY